MGAQEWILLLVLSVIWGASFVFLKVLVESLPPLTIVAARLAISAAVLNLVTGGAAFRPAVLARWPEFLALAVLSTAVPFSLITFGETRITSGLASILNATTPMFVVLVAHAFTQDERLSWNRGLGVVAGFAGVAILIGPTALSGVGRGGAIGEIACLVASAIYGCSSVFARRFRDLAPMQVVTGQLTAATLLTAPLSLIFDRPFGLPPPPPAAWASLAGLALICTALAFVIYFRIIARAGATNVSLVTLLSPPSAILLGVLFLHERPELRSLAGLAVIGLGLAAIDGRPIRWVWRPRG
jgi:drug/metabolite transporter (DMT)-like permease